MNCEIPEEFGGLGLSCLSHCMILEEIAWACAGVNTSMAANALASLPIIIAGNREQKDLPGLAHAGADLRRIAARNPTLARMWPDCARTLSKTVTATC